MAETLADQLADFATETTLETLPPGLVGDIRNRVLDSVGVSLGALYLDTSTAVLRYVCSQGGRPEAHAWGSERRVPAAGAALVNGVLAHSLDYDDTHLPSVIHPSASVVPTALAVAEATGSSGPEMITAIAVGLEIAVRIGMAGYDEAARTSTYFEHGQHATSICGALGAAVTAAKLYGLRRDGIRDALGIVASMSSGIIESNRSGGTVKRLHCGWAAHSAVTAAALAAAGITGPPTVLEGRFGLFQAFLRGHFDENAVGQDLGLRWNVPDILYKPYPANHFTHTAVDAGRKLRDSGIDLNEIEELVLGVPASVVRTIGEPLDLKRRPTTGYQAQFSGPYAVALGLLSNAQLGATLDDYADDLVSDPLRRALMARVSVVADAECTDIFPRQFPSVLTARFRDGSTRVVRAMTNRGTADNPFGPDDLTIKFVDTAARAVGAIGAQRLVASIGRLDRMADISELVDDIVRALAEYLQEGRNANS